jgi:hypothetical protein
MYYQDHEPERLITRRTPTAGAIYLQGYADGYHNRPRIIQRTRKAQAAYSKGYEAGSQARPKPSA